MYWFGCGLVVVGLRAGGTAGDHDGRLVPNLNKLLSKESRKKVCFNGRAIKTGGGGCKGLAIKEKRTLFCSYLFHIKKVPMVIRLEGRGVRP